MTGNRLSFRFTAWGLCLAHASRCQPGIRSVGAVKLQPECLSATTVKAPARWQHLDRRLPVRWHLVGDPALRAGRLRWKAVFLGRAPDHHAIAEVIGRHLLAYLEAVFLPGGLRDVAPLDHGLAGQLENGSDVGQQVIHDRVANSGLFLPHVEPGWRQLQQRARAAV